MRRRRLFGAGLALAACHRSAPAQPVARKVRIGFLSGSGASPSTTRGMVDPLRLGLRELGYIEGQNLVIEFRWAEGQPERLPGLLAELIRLEPEVLVTTGTRPPMLAKQATSTLPIVAVAIDDPVQMGLATNISRPGGNITGISGAFSGLLSRRFQLLKDIVPSARKFALLFNPNTASRADIVDSVSTIERTLGVSVLLLEARGPEDFDRAFAAMSKDRVDAVAILADPTLFAHRIRLGELCLKQRLPSVWGHKDYLEGGGLVSYQGDFAAMFRRSAALIDKILKGTKPGDIAFEQSTKFDLVVNLKAARALGITIPQSVLVSADEVIE